MSAHATVARRSRSRFRARERFDRGAIISQPGTRAAVEGVVNARVHRPEAAKQRGIRGVDDGVDL
jgi:hypothetical protein